MHSRSVLVSAISEKGDEQGGEDCLSSSRFSNLCIPGTFAGISLLFSGGLLIVPLLRNSLRSDSPRSGAYPPVKTIRKSAA